MLLGAGAFLGMGDVMCNGHAVVARRWALDSSMSTAGWAGWLQRVRALTLSAGATCSGSRLSVAHPAPPVGSGPDTTRSRHHPTVLCQAAELCLPDGHGDTTPTLLPTSPAHTAPDAHANRRSAPQLSINGAAATPPFPSSMSIFSNMPLLNPQLPGEAPLATRAASLEAATSKLRQDLPSTRCCTRRGPHRRPQRPTAVSPAMMPSRARRRGPSHRPAAVDWISSADSLANLLTNPSQWLALPPPPRYWMKSTPCCQ